ncbi:MAG: 3-keto-5-aminohexanoate cleavage protein [Eubacteriales bacterium]|nr:3-keto-5-aminohexanoate cleavage protein [Eubacteriales bacterium]
MRKVIISVAPVAGSDPLIPEQLAEDVAKCAEYGASMCHLHCKTREGKLTPDIGNLVQAFEKILEKTDVVVQASTGGISEMNIEQRCYPLEYQKVESASLNGGSTNLGEAVYRNSFDDIRYCARACYDRLIIPETEVFDIGMIHNVELVRKEVPMRTPVIYNLVFGHKGGMQPTIEALMAFRSFVPKDALWGITHFGRDNWTFLAAAVAAGASIVRIGFEDSRYLKEGIMANYNYEEVRYLADLIHQMGMETATPKETREMMGIPEKRNT